MKIFILVTLQMFLFTFITSSAWENCDKNWNKLCSLYCQSKNAKEIFCKIDSYWLKKLTRNKAVIKDLQYKFNMCFFKVLNIEKNAKNKEEDGKFFRPRHSDLKNTKLSGTSLNQVEISELRQNKLSEFCERFFNIKSDSVKYVKCKCSIDFIRKINK